MTLENAQGILPLSSHQSGLLADVRHSRGTSFAGAQLFLQRAPAQLTVGDQTEKRSRDRAAIIVENIRRSAYERDLRFGFPIDEEQRMEYLFMTMSPKKLADLEFKLSLTPTRLAARYIR
jgi:hypothetical protein